MGAYIQSHHQHRRSIRIVSLSFLSCILSSFWIVRAGHLASANTRVGESSPERSGEVVPPEQPVEPRFQSAPSTRPTPPPVQQSPSPAASRDDLDPDLGRLRLRPLALPTPPPPPALYLLGNVGYFRSNNIFAGIDPVDDGLIASRISLLAVPSLGTDTSIVMLLSGGIVRYDTRPQADYNELRTYVGLSQKLFDNTYGEVGWRSQYLFDRAGGDRFLNDQALYLALSRQDFLSPQLTIDSSYQFRRSFADPESRNQTIHALTASLGYGFQPNLRLDLSYQLAWATFVQQPRDDTYHQVTMRLSYGTLNTGRISIFAGQSFGTSSSPTIKFDGFLMGISVDIGLPF